MFVPDSRSINGSRCRDPGKIESREFIILDHGKANLALPPAVTQRWTPRRKAAVIVATRAGVMTREEACERYTLSDEELAGWEAAFDQNGIHGLRITALRSHRVSLINR
jgi:hypothetical protein